MLKYKLFMKAALVAAIVLTAKYFSDRFGFSQITINTLTSSFFAGVFFTISILFTAAMTDFKEAEKIPGELAVLMKALRNDAKLVCAVGNDCPETQNIVAHVEGLLSAIMDNFRSNCWHKARLDEQFARINQDIISLSTKNVASGVITKIREHLTNVDRLSHRIDYIGYTDDIPGAYIVSDIALCAVFLIFIFSNNEWGAGGLVLFGAITFVLSAIIFLIHDMDNPFEYGHDSLADVDLSVLFRLENIWKGVEDPEGAVLSVPRRSRLKVTGPLK
jgi:hypothetical protein